MIHTRESYGVPANSVFRRERSGKKGKHRVVITRRNFLKESKNDRAGTDDGV